MSGASVWTIAAIVLLFLFAVFLAMGETAVLRMSKVKAMALQEEGRRGARHLVQLLEQPEQTVNGISLLALFAQTVTANLVGLAFASNLGTGAQALVILGNFLVFYVFGEAAPKTWALQHSTRSALAVAPFMRFLTMLWPVRWLARGLLGFVNWFLPGKGLKDGPFVTAREIRAMADVAAGEAAIEDEERHMIHSIFEFGDTVVREVMRPRPDVISVDVNASVESAISTLIDAGFSRAPAFSESTSNLVGLVYLKDLVKRASLGDTAGNLHESVRPAQYVPESKKVSDLLQQMRLEKFHMALVVDEYGDTSGLVTLEDLLEEIVGEIVDEYDVEEPELVRISDVEFLAPGGMHISDLNEELGSELPDDEWDTVGGLVFALAGHVPTQGEIVAYRNYEFCAERIEGRRIVSVRVTVLPFFGDGESDDTEERADAERAATEPAAAADEAP